MKKNKLNLFVVIFLFLYIVLPSYFALEITEFFPLLTGSRIILLILILVNMLKKKIKIKIFKDSKLLLAFSIYYILKLLANIFYIPITTDAIKDIFSMILEELLIIWIIPQVINSKEKLVEALEILAISCGVVAILSIVNFVFKINVFYYLNTVKRNMLMANYTRMGMIRAEAGFGHPVYYGVYNTIMIPIIVFLIQYKDKNLKYKIILFLTIIALVLANSRGTILVVLFMFLYMLINAKKRNIKKCIPLVLVLLFVLLIFCLYNSEFWNYISKIFMSIINVFYSGGQKIEGYGDNANGLDSRITQFSQVIWTAKNNFVFGLGAGAQNREAIKYLATNGKWQVLTTFDVGYFAIFCQYGLLGVIAYSTLYYSILKRVIISTKMQKNNIEKMFKYVFISYLLCLLSTTGLEKLFWIIFGLFIAYINIEKTNINQELDIKNKKYKEM